MRKFKGIVQSNKAPTDQQVLWLHKDRLFYFEGGWRLVESLTTADKQEIVDMTIAALPKYNGEVR